MAQLPAQANSNADLPDDARPGEYVVVARRYRPQAFEELVGQEHVARAMSNAITSNRVGHAYLFTGARGVGKTSSARILAKCLDCVEGPTPTPCNRCEICQSISAGNDIDVLEIDGASNNGVDEIRSLRQNALVRPSRARFKIYIIDEVHMLSKSAFNALLKTLEEPPEHVKFIFCTTEAEKIPITILSRCQRFDFAGITPASIVGRLEQIVAAEGVAAEPEALEILARRAAGSMRDSQSLLEQLLAFGGRKIAVADVHAMLGTAADGRLAALVTHLVERNAAAALADLDAALADGVDVGQLLDQLLGYFRDVMAACAGCLPQSFLHAGSGEQAAVQAAGKNLGLETVLAILQILDQTLARMRYSTHRRTLAELALVRISALEDLDKLADLAGALASGLVGSLPTGGARPVASAAASVDTAKKKPDEPHEPVKSSPEIPTIQQAATPVTAQNVSAIWKQVLDTMQDMIADNASMAESVAISGPNRLVATFPLRYNFQKTLCERPESVGRLEAALAEAVGSIVKLEFRLADSDGEVAADRPQPQRPVSQRARLMEKSQNPLVRRAEELFKARPVAVEEPHGG